VFHADHADLGWMMTFCSSDPLEAACRELDARIDGMDPEALLKDVTALLTALKDGADLPETEGMTKEMANVVVIISFVLSLVALLPQIYVGVKGIKIANGAPSGKAHIVWAIILAVFAAIAVISAISNLTKVLNFDAVLTALDPAIDVVIYVFYYIYARKIAKA
jgi:hypothetical protein